MGGNPAAFFPPWSYEVRRPPRSATPRGSSSTGVSPPCVRVLRKLLGSQCHRSSVARGRCGP
eukprot:15456520-Alexandrium_andersonii.AAC.1